MNRILPVGGETDSSRIIKKFWVNVTMEKVFRDWLEGIGFTL